MTMPWQPVIDGESFPVPARADRGGSAAQVDLIVGTNTDDWKLFLAITGEIGQITDDALTGACRRPRTSRSGCLRAPGRAGARGIPSEVSRGGRWGPARRGADRLVGTHSGDPPGRRPRHRHLGHLHVRVRLARTGTRRRPRAGGPLRLRHPDQGRTALRRCSGTTRPRSSRTPCTPPGCRSPPMATRAGPGTTCTAGPRCASTRRLGWSTTPGPGSGPCGRASARADRTQRSPRPTRTGRRRLGVDAESSDECLQWFLSTEERGTPATRLDSRHTDSKAWSEGNLVRPLVHGSRYFEELAQRVAEMQAGDLLMFADWRGDPDERLTGLPGSEVGRVLEAASRRGVDVRGLVAIAPRQVRLSPVPRTGASARRSTRRAASACWTCASERGFSPPEVRRPPSSRPTGAGHRVRRRDRPWPQPA